MRYQARSFAFIAALFLIASCAHMTVPAAGNPPAPLPSGTSAPLTSLGPTPCPNVKLHNPKGPVVCIDSNMNADPDPVQASRGAWIHFYADDARTTLDVLFDDSRKFELKGCSAFACWVRVKDDATYGKTHYTASYPRGAMKSKDPEIEIVP